MIGGGNRYFSDKDRAQKTAKIQIEFIQKQKITLKPKLQEALQGFSDMIKRNEQFTPNQLSFIDGIYEKAMEKLGFESVKTKHDIRKKY